MSTIVSLFKKSEPERLIHFVVPSRFKMEPKTAALKSALEVIEREGLRPDLKGRCLPSVLDSQHPEFVSKELAIDRKTLTKTLPQGREVDLSCVDGVKINGFYVPGSSERAVLFLHGNGGFYETCWDQALDIKKTIAEDVHLMMFNPRGTGKSQGEPCGRNLALDVMAAFLFLVEAKDLSPSNIIIYGHSMGGCIGALGAELIQQLFPEETIHLVSDRSFSSMTDHLDAFSKRVAEAGFLARGVPRSQPLGGWQMDAMNAITSLKGRVCVIYDPEDEIIVKEASLFYQMQEKNLLPHPRISSLELQYPPVADEIGHSRPLRGMERQELQCIWKLFFC